jgi:hypothetical protein
MVILFVLIVARDGNAVCECCCQSSRADWRSTPRLTPREIHDSMFAFAKPLAPLEPEFRYESKWPSQHWASYPTWFPREVERIPHLEPLWTFAHEGDEVAAILKRVSEDSYQARFYRVSMMIAESHPISRARAVQWSDKQRQRMERSSAALTA